MVPEIMIGTFSKPSCSKTSHGEDAIAFKVSRNGFDQRCNRAAFDQAAGGFDS
jgi:hypothetical protein